MNIRSGNPIVTLDKWEWGFLNTMGFTNASLDLMSEGNYAFGEGELQGIRALLDTDRAAGFRDGYAYAIREHHLDDDE